MHIYDIFVLICNEIKIQKLPKLELVSKYHKHNIKNFEWINNTLLVTNELLLRHILQNYNFKNLQITFDANAYIGDLQNFHTLILDNYIHPDNVSKLKKCHTVHFICGPSHLPNENLQKLKYCHTIRTYSAIITNECLKKLKNCHKLELRYPQSFITNNLDHIMTSYINFANPFITDYGIKYLKKCHTLYLNTPYVTNNGILKLKNCHTLYLNSWHIRNKSIKKLYKCYKIYLLTQYITPEHIKKLGNDNVVHYNVVDVDE
jgi:hypothetical protein